MKFLFDNIPIAVVIAGICMLMLYPYIGAGLLLAALCFEAEQYVLMVVSFLICVLLQSIMGKHIKPHHVQVPPSRASRGKRAKKKKRRKKTGAHGQDQETGATVPEEYIGSGNPGQGAGITNPDHENDATVPKEYTGASNPNQKTGSAGEGNNTGAAKPDQDSGAAAADQQIETRGDSDGKSGQA